MSLKTYGIIHKINPIEQVTEKFKKREFVLEISNDGAYVQKVLFTATRDNVEFLDTFKKGDSVDVEFDVKGREWTSPTGDIKYFNTLEIVNITLFTNNQTQQTVVDSTLRTVVANDSSKEEDDDLPF
jgi:hypothetical protein